ncbi:unnamed protein product, partial [Laminaria digitata]
PSQNLKPETSRHLSAFESQQILKRQDSRCNCCGQSITLYPFANCDADHIARICRGGKTVPEDVQLLCVQDHRAKSAREAKIDLR